MTIIYCLRYILVVDCYSRCGSLNCCMSLFHNSSFVIILLGKRELVALLGLLSWCLTLGDGCVALPRGAMGLSAVCDCGIS